MPIKDTRSPFSLPLFILSQLILLFALVVRSNSIRRFLFLPFLAITCHLILNTTTGNIANDHALGCALFAYLFMGSDYLLLTNPHKELRHIGQQHEDIANAPFWTRVGWAADLLCSARGIGWAHEPKALIWHQPKLVSRTRWLLSDALSVAGYVLLYDAANIYNMWNVSTQMEGGFLEVGVMRMLGLMFYGVSVAASVNAVHGIVALVAVGVGSSDPEGWPPLLGDWRCAYTVRNFWSCVLSCIFSLVLAIDSCFDFGE